jgi:hypothetical protein
MRLRREERATQRVTTIVRVVVHRPTIEHGFPYVSTNRGSPRTWEYPYGDMQIGDSFHVPLTVVTRNVLSSRISAHNKLNPETRFESRKAIGENGEDGTRVWRTR